MQLPSLRMPTLNTGDWFEDFPARQFSLYALYTVVLFLLFLIVNFPYRVFVDRLLNDVNTAGAEIDVHEANFAFTRGLELRGITVRRSEVSRLPLVEVPRAYLWPGLAGLLNGRLSKASVQGDLYAGGLKAKWRGGEDLQQAVVQIEGVQLARYAPLRELFADGQIYGLLSGYVEMEGRSGDLSSTKANGEIYLDNAGSEGLIYGALPVLDLSFVETKAVFTVQNGRIEVEEFTSIGPDFDISGSGQIGLRTPLADSILDLKVSIQALEDARPEVKGLARLIPRARGAKPSSPISITGTMANPRVR